jgi:uncharacterized membrane protein
MYDHFYYESSIKSSKRLVWWLYLMHSLSILFSLGLFSFIPLLINYLKRGDTEGTFLYSHHSWQISSFWWYLFWMMIGGVFFITLVGVPVAAMIWLGALAWKTYRLLRGFLNVSENEPMPE